MKQDDIDMASPYGKFTDVEVRTIYDVFIDRYEHLDLVLRSLPKYREEARQEKARVEAIIRRICDPYTT